MELSIQQQIFDQLRHANKILVVLPEQLTADSLASGLALRLFLTKLDKDVTVACSGPVPEHLKFLPGADAVAADFSASKSFVVTLNTSQKKLEEVSYQTLPDKVQIFLKPRDVAFTENDLSFSSEQSPADVIVALEASSLESLGGLFEKHADLFFETPKISIDHKADNEYFGAINLVDITATSVAEILLGLLEQFEAQLIDEHIATCLLAGIITKTHSFQHSHTTPQAFLKASQLINLGGRQQEIIKHVYKTKSMSLLKLWGRCLARLKTGGRNSFIYSLLNAADFEKSEAGPEEILPVLKELLENISGYKLVAVIAEQSAQGVRVALAVHDAVAEQSLREALPQAGKALQALGQFRVYDFNLPELSLADAERRFVAGAEKLSLPAAVNTPS